MVFLPPRHGKSELISRHLPAWWLGHFPDERVLLASYEASFAGGWGLRARRILEEYGEHFWGVRVSQESRARDQWEVQGRKGGMVAVGVGGAATGRGADLLIIDDPIKDQQEALSPTYRARAWDWYRATAYTRLEPDGVVILLMTRWHYDDLAGRILSESSEEWKVVSLPAFAEEGDELGRELGAPLWVERFGHDELERIQQVQGSRWFDAMYQQRPAPEEGGDFRREWWRRYSESEKPPQFQEILQSWDMALKATSDGSYVVGQAWGRNGANRYLLRQVRKRMTFTESVAAMRNLTEWVNIHYPEHHNHVKLVEDAANGAAVMDSLRNELSGIVGVRASQSKLTRALAVAPVIEAGDVYLPGEKWADDLIEEFAHFPNGANDDQVDATSQALARLGKRRLTAVSPASVTAASGWRG